MKRIYYIINIFIFLSFLCCNENGINSIPKGVITLILHTNKGSFNEISKFNITIHSIKIVRDDNAYSDIFDNRNALRDNPDTYNICSDSIFVIGDMYLPCDNFVSVLLYVTPEDSLIYDNKNIAIKKNDSFDALVKLDTNLSIHSDKTYTFIISTNIDSLLIPQKDFFVYRHYYSIEKIYEN